MNRDAARLIYVRMIFLVSRYGAHVQFPIRNTSKVYNRWRGFNFQLINSQRNTWLWTIRAWIFACCQSVFMTVNIQSELKWSLKKNSLATINANNNWIDKLTKVAHRLTHEHNGYTESWQLRGKNGSHCNENKHEKWIINDRFSRRNFMRQKI